jgi:outer membrane protein assembly factor BamD (BamD/ComL family)
MLRSALIGCISTALYVLLLGPGTQCVRAETVDTNPLSRQPEVQQAFELFYNMDYDEALPRFEKIRREHPNDPS